MTVFIDILAFAAALGPLIIFHELGHYFAARWFKVRVLRFSLGFGRPLVKWVRGRDRTEWTIAAFPFGGFVAMLDEREAEHKDQHYSEEELARAFNRQSVWARIVIVAAGPVTNFIVAFFIYIVVYLYGVAEPRAILAEPAPQSIAARAGVRGGDEVLSVDGHAVASLVSLRFRLVKDAVDAQDPQLVVHSEGGGERQLALDFSRMTPDAVEGDLLGSAGIVLMPAPSTIESVTPNGPADRGGLKVGDRVLAVDNTKVTQVDQLKAAIRAAPARSLILTVARGEGQVELRVTPDARQQGDAPAYGAIDIGLPPPQMAQVRYGPIDSVTHAVSQTLDMTGLSARMLLKMVQGQISIKNLSGPITIADYAGQTAHLGLGIFLTLIAFISINLGLMNLLPIPMLDGGHLLYYLVEIIQRRPPSERFLEMSQRAGVAVLACLMCVALFNDFSRLLS